MKQLYRLIALMLLLTVAMASPVWSGTTGKIAGTLTDKDTGEPLFGANITVVGTSLGAASDIDGQYTILHVPPGIYTVSISYIGYRKVTIEDVRVNIDQTARVDVELEMESIVVGEMVVMAERELIKKDVATSVVAVTSDEIGELPINNVISAIGLQAGIRGGWGGNPNGASQPTFVSGYQRGKVSVQGGLSIRGGDGDNILFMLDGITLRDPRNNEPITQIPLAAVKEVSVERGGFNAEYGQVRSGIVNVITREGEKNSYYGSFQGRVSPAARKYQKVDGVYDIQDPNSYVLRPFFDDEVCWTGTGSWDQYTRDQYPEFEGWNEISRKLCTDNDPNNDLTPLGAQRVFEYETRKKQVNDQPDYDIDAGLGGPIPYIGKMLGDLRFFTSYRSSRDMLIFPLTRPDYKDYNWTGQITSDITPSLKLRVSGLMGKQATIRHNWDGTGSYFYPHYASEIAGVASAIAATSDLITLFSDFNFCLADIEHKSISAKITHTISSTTFYEVSLETFRRTYDVRPSATRDTSQVTEVIPGFYEDSNPFGLWYGTTNGVIITGGMHVARLRDFSEVGSTTFKADFTSQINFSNLLKAGIEYNYNDLDFDYGVVASGTEGKAYSNRVQMRVFPYRASAYLQDKLETEGFTVNAGLRLDYYNSNTAWWELDPYTIEFFSSQYNATADFLKKDAEGQWQLSPRLGIAHPITENSKLFFNYGHFKQIPQYESLFRLQRASDKSMSSYGNPNLTQARTISYELGFDYIFSEDVLLQIAAFYNDITDQQDFTQYFSTAAGYSYTSTSANNYQDTRGFEITLRKTIGRWWSGFINYTYQVNTTGHFGSARQYDNASDQKLYDDATVNSYQDRPIPQPYARASVNLSVPDDWGPTFFGHNILGGWMVNFVLDWQAGYWTTWNPKGLASIAYNVQAVDYFGATMRFQKTIDLGNFNVQLFMDISNLFNTLRLWNTGDQDYLMSLHLPKSAAYDNIPGDDLVGDYREPGVDFQPIEYVAGISSNISGNDGAIYYVETPPDGYSSHYFEYTNGAWKVVDNAKIDKILDDKAYIDMPNASTFWFLDPRKIYFGMRVSFNL